MIGLFQNQRNWQTIKEQVLDLVEEDHSVGRAQNGSLTEKLETVLAKRFNRQHCVTTASCTDALIIGLLAMDLKPNSKVLLLHLHTPLHVLDILLYQLTSAMTTVMILKQMHLQWMQLLALTCLVICVIGK